MFDFVIAQRLFSSDLRMLACRSFPDPRERGYCKALVRANGRALYLCPRRVEAFLGDAVSIAGIACVGCVPPVEDA